MRRSPAYLSAPSSMTPPERTPCQGSSPVRVPAQSVSSSHFGQEPSGLPEFSGASLPACHGLMTPADVRTLALGACFMHFRERDLPYGLQDSLCTLARFSVRGLRRSATGPTLDTGGWLVLTRPGLSPGKRRRGLLGATTTTKESISIFQYSGNPDSYPRKPQPACANPPKPAALAAGCNAEHWPRAALGAKRTAAAAARPTGFP
jgi:hypothetical protein